MRQYQQTRDDFFNIEEDNAYVPKQLKLKFGQNTVGEYAGWKYESTMTFVVFKRGNKQLSAGVIRWEDFDLEALFKIAGCKEKDSFDDNTEFFERKGKKNAKRKHY